MFRCEKEADKRARLRSEIDAMMATPLIETTTAKEQQRLRRDAQARVMTRFGRQRVRGHAWQARPRD